MAILPENRRPNRSKDISRRTTAFQNMIYSRKRGVESLQVQQAQDLLNPPCGLIKIANPSVGQLDLDNSSHTTF